MSVAVVTGGNRGIGYSIVRKLCTKLQPGSIVILTSRDVERGNDAVERLRKEGVNPTFHQLDIESVQSVKRLGEFIRQQHGGLDILVNNAGIAFFTAPSTPLKLQAEKTLNVNYFGTLRVCDELFPLMRNNGRVVNLSSGLGHLSKINGAEPFASGLRERLSSPLLTVGELNGIVDAYITSASSGTHTQQGYPNSAYALSKVAVTALSFIQQRDFDNKRPNDGIIVNAVHPGWVQSEMTGFRGHYTTDEGAEAPVYAALLQPNDKCPRGQYIWCDKGTIDWVDKRELLDKMKG